MRHDSLHPGDRSQRTPRGARSNASPVVGLERLPRYHAALAVGIAGALAISCAGPQSLTRAIRPADEATYVQQLNAVNQDARAAFTKWMTEERKLSPADYAKYDSALPSDRNPFDAHGDPTAVGRGAVLFRLHCARCHGEDARGRGPSALPTHPAPDFHDFAHRFAATVHRGAPKRWFKVINEGSGETVTYPTGKSLAMPPFGSLLTREQIWLAITYLQSLEVHAAPRAKAAPGGPPA